MVPLVLAPREDEMDAFLPMPSCSPVSQSLNALASKLIDKFNKLMYDSTNTHSQWFLFLSCVVYSPEKSLLTGRGIAVE